MKTDSGDATLTASNGNLQGVSTSIVWNDVGDGVTLLYTGQNGLLLDNME